MKKFKYRAESFLKYLTFQREESLRQLKKAERFRDRLLEEYSRMENQMKGAFQYNSEVGKLGRDIRLVNDNNQFIQKLQASLSELSVEIQQAEDIFQEKHKALLDLQLKVKKMELHKDVELEKFKKEYKKQSQKQTDEINSTRKRGLDAKSI